MAFYNKHMFTVLPFHVLSKCKTKQNVVMTNDEIKCLKYSHTWKVLNSESTSYTSVFCSIFFSFFVAMFRSSGISLTGRIRENVFRFLQRVWLYKNLEGSWCKYAGILTEPGRATRSPSDYLSRHASAILPLYRWEGRVNTSLLLGSTGTRTDCRRYSKGRC